VPLPLPQRPDAVLLDLDGTLSASGPAIVTGIAAALAAVGAPPLDPIQLQGFLGPPLVDSFAALPGFDAARADAAVMAYRASYDPVAPPLFDGALRTLTTLRAGGLRLALATSKPQPYAERVVDGHGLRPLLEAVVGWAPEQGRRTKGDCVAEALRLLGHPAAPVMVGDRIHDVEGAAEHGVPCIGALWGYAAEGELDGASARVGRITDLPGLLL
jgi:phosphoglycolate phosphatase